MTKRTLFFWACAASVGAVLNIHIFQSPLLGVPVTLIYLFTIASWVSQSYARQLPHRFFWSALLSFFSLSLLTTAAYYLAAITPMISSIVLCIPLLLFFKKQHTPSSSPSLGSTYTLVSSGATWLSLGALLVQAAILAILIANRTTDLLVSPWQAVGPDFFLLYLGGILLTGIAAYKASSNAVRFLLVAFALFNTYAVAAILYVYGFGFDGFIHRATEEWIKTHGFISPKTPFYIGQHSFIVWLSFVTGIGIHALDIYFVPVLTSLILPPLVAYTLKYVWNIKERIGIHLVWIFPFLYFITLNLTTPHNVTLLLSIITIFTTLASVKKRLPFFIPLSFSLLTCTVHPLIGAPMVLFVTTALFIQKSTKQWQKLFLLLIGTTGLATLPTIMFAINNYLGGYGLPTLINPLYTFSEFLVLFERPYWYNADAPLLFELLYTYQWMIAPLVIFLAIYGLSIKKLSIQQLLFPLAALGFVVGAWMLRSFIIFPNLTSAEATNYPMRLIWASLLFLLPWTMYAIIDGGKIFYSYVQHRSLLQRRLVLGGSLLIIAAMLTVSYYFSYPQKNPKVQFPGFNVTEADFEAVQWIHNQEDEYDYIVLSNPLVGVAAMTEYSFAKYHDTPNGETFYYSIPSGGPLYPYYLDMVYQEQANQTMQDAMNFADVDTAYFVINSYWKHYDQIVAGAKKTADRWHVIGDNEVTVFVYEKE